MLDNEFYQIKNIFTDNGYSGICLQYMQIGQASSVLFILFIKAKFVKIICICKYTAPEKN